MPIRMANIILDIFILIFAAFAVLVSLTMIWIMIVHQRPSANQRTTRLLSVNMFTSLFIGCAIMFDMYCYTLYGHLHPTVSLENQWCYIRSYLLYVSGCSFFYSYLLQAIYRLCRIVFYRKLFLQSFSFFVGGMMIQWTFSFLQVIPLYILGAFKYLPEDFHCQIPLTNIKGLLVGLSLVHMIPISLTTICYIYTVVYLRKHRNVIRTRLQRASDRRDFHVLTQIFLVLAVMIASGFPQLGISLFYQCFDYLPYWSTQFQWFTATFSVFCVSVILMFVSPNLQSFAPQPCASPKDTFSR